MAKNRRAIFLGFSVLVSCASVTPRNPASTNDACPIQAPLNCLVNDALRCQADLLNEVEGFAKAVSGGQGGTIYHVNTLGDDKHNPPSGSLRWALQQPGKKWIVFDVSGVIDLRAKLRIPSDTTVDGRGAAVTIRGNAVSISGATNVIFNDLAVTDSSPNKVGNEEGNDNITVGKDARLVWIHHVATSHSGDGLIDIVDGATDVTVSWTRLFDKPNKAMLIAGSDGQGPLSRITLHHNHWYKDDDRLPKIGGAMVHIYNNFYDQSHKGIDITCYSGCQAFVENNVWYPDSTSDRKMDVTADGAREGFARVTGNFLKHGCRLDEHRPERVFTPPYAYRAEAITDDLVCRVALHAGPRG